MSKRLQGFLGASFEALESEGISFCILRNYENLPEHNASRDIDMLVDEARLAAVERTLGMLAPRFDLRLQRVIRGRRCVLSGLTEEGIFYLPIDLHTNEESYGWIYLAGAEILDRRRKYKSFYVPHPVDEALICWLASYLSGGFIQTKYADKIRAAITQHEPGFRSTLCRIAGTRLGEEMLALAKTEGLESTLRLRRKVFLRVVWRSFITRPSKQVRSTIRFLARQLQVRFRPPGTMTAILGVDGSGKSTVASELARKVHDVLRIERVTVVHWRPGLLPPLRRVLMPWKRKQSSNGPVVNPHGREPSGLCGSYLRFLYYLSDFTLGYYLVTLDSIRRGGFVLFDRYYYDYLFDQRRSRISLPLWVVRCLQPLIPKPDVILCLGADPEVMYARKPEVSLKEVRRQTEVLQQFCRRTKGAVWIDTGCSVEESVTQALNAVVVQMAMRI